MPARHIVAIGASDAGISAAVRIRELDPTTNVTVVVADAYPNFSICGIPYYVSGEVTHWTHLAHRTAADLAATGMRVLCRSLTKPGGLCVGSRVRAFHLRGAGSTVAGRWAQIKALSRSPPTPRRTLPPDQMTRFKRSDTFIVVTPGK